MARNMLVVASLIIVFLALYPSVFATVLSALFIHQPLKDPTPRTPYSNSGSSANSLPHLFYHLGGNGPWIPKISGTIEKGMEPPEGCRVSQVHMLSRHAERYPTMAAATRMHNLHTRIHSANTTLNGTLAFALTWPFFITDPTHIENLTTTGPYAGTLQAFTTGTKLRTRYADLLSDTGTTTYWASDSARVIDTARYFGAGFFGLDSDSATLEIIPETPDRGADTLTPGRTCRNYRNDVDKHGHGYGYKMMDAFRSTCEPAIVARLAEQNPDFRFTEDEVFTMQLLCGFEMLARGGSEWCDVFTAEEWESFEYARDVIHYYRSGPGNPYGASMGWLWLNATTNLLVEGPESAGPLFLSFVHDGDLIPALTALDLFPQHPDLPTTHILTNRALRTSDVVPMGGRLILERLACPAQPDCWSNAPLYPNHVYCAPPDHEEDVFVRVNVNDGVVGLPGCDGGPGRSCPLGEFVERVKVRGRKVGRFGEVCGLPEGVPKRMSFLHQ